MLGRAGALGRRVAAQHDALRALPPPQPMCAAAAPLLNSRWLDAAAGNSSVVAAQSGSAVRWRGFASGNSGALTTIQGKTSLSSTARALLVDTMEMVRSFERVGMSRQQAEALTEHLTEVLCSHKEKLTEGFVSKTLLERTILEQNAATSSFKSEVFKAQDMHHTTLNRDSERLSNDMQKIRSEIRYEVDKLTASQRLDLNLEKGRMRDELQALRDKGNELEIKIDKEINALKAAVEFSKNETIKYSLGMLFALLTVGLGVVRLLL